MVGAADTCNAVEGGSGTRAAAKEGAVPRACPCLSTRYPYNRLGSVSTLSPSSGGMSALTQVSGAAATCLSSPYRCSRSVAPAARKEGMCKTYRSGATPRTVQAATQGIPLARVTRARSNSSKPLPVTEHLARMWTK